MVKVESIVSAALAKLHKDAGRRQVRDWIREHYPGQFNDPADKGKITKEFNRIKAAQADAEVRQALVALKINPAAISDAESRWNARFAVDQWIWQDDRPRTEDRGDGPEQLHPDKEKIRKAALDRVFRNPAWPFSELPAEEPTVAKSKPTTAPATEPAPTEVKKPKPTNAAATNLALDTLGDDATGKEVFAWLENHFGKGVFLESSINSGLGRVKKDRRGETSTPRKAAHQAPATPTGPEIIHFMAVASEDQQGIDEVLSLVDKVERYAAECGGLAKLKKICDVVSKVKMFGNGK